jgi:hypothetical protein
LFNLFEPRLRKSATKLGFRMQTNVQGSWACRRKIGASVAQPMNAFSRVLDLMSKRLRRYSKNTSLVDNHSKMAELFVFLCNKHLQDTDSLSGTMLID